MKVNFFGIRKPIITIFIISFLLICFPVDRWMQYKTVKSESLINISEVNSDNKAQDTVSFTVETFTPSIRTSLVSNQTYKTTEAFAKYQPKYFQTTIDSSNYGDRYSTDIHSKTLDNQPIAVLHETVGSASSAINTFRTHHSCLLYTSPSPRDLSTSRMPSSA